MNYLYNKTGYEVLDEKVQISYPITVDGQSLYYGFLNHIPDRNTAVMTTTTHGCWTASSKGGSRRNVYIDGLPTSTDITVVADSWAGIPSNVLLSATNQTVYCYYLGHGCPFMGNYKIEVPYLLAGADPLVKVFNTTEFRKISDIAIDINGSLPSQEATFTLTNSDWNETLTFAVEDQHTVISLSEPFKMYTGQWTLATANGYGISDFTILLEGKMP